MTSFARLPAIAWIVCFACVRAEAQTAITLRRGINLTHWLSPWAGDQVRNVRGPLAAVDLAYLRRMGFDHLRLVVDPEQMWNASNPGAPRTTQVATLGEAITKITEAGFRVVVDMQPFEEPTKDYVYNKDKAAQFEVFWGAMARYIRRWDPAWVAMELLNEPRQTDPKAWRRQAEGLIAAIRAQAPNHTIVVGAQEWSRAQDLMNFQPIEGAANVIYAFHFYEPQDFTHQGIQFGAEHWKVMRNVPWPFDAERIEPMLGDIPDEQVRNWLRYAAVKHRWTTERVRQTMADCAAWGRRHNVPVWCGEFGVYPKFSKPEHRLGWLRDVRTALEQEQLPWCVWDYQGTFGIMTRQADGTPTVEAGVIEALGMNQP
jgi:hypothetical protein